MVLAISTDVMLREDNGFAAGVVLVVDETVVDVAVVAVKLKPADDIPPPKLNPVKPEGLVKGALPPNMELDFAVVVSVLALSSEPALANIVLAVSCATGGLFRVASIEGFVGVERKENGVEVVVGTVKLGLVVDSVLLTVAQLPILADEVTFVGDEAAPAAVVDGLGVTVRSGDFTGVLTGTTPLRVKD